MFSGMIKFATGHMPVLVKNGEINYNDQQPSMKRISDEIQMDQMIDEGCPNVHVLNVSKNSYWRF